METATYYAKKLYHNNIFCGCVRDPAIVLDSFKHEIEKHKPVHFSCNGSNRLYATFIHDHDMIFYELPLHWNIDNGGNNK